MFVKKADTGHFASGSPIRPPWFGGRILSCLNKAQLDRPWELTLGAVEGMPIHGRHGRDLEQPTHSGIEAVGDGPS
jgi:hypothetical protein